MKVVAYAIPKNGMSYFKLSNQLYDVCYFCHSRYRVLGFIVYSFWFSSISVEWKFSILIFNEVFLFIKKKKPTMEGIKSYDGSLLVGPKKQWEPFTLAKMGTRYLLSFSFLEVNDDVWIELESSWTFTIEGKKLIWIGREIGNSLWKVQFRVAMEAM